MKWYWITLISIASIYLFLSFVYLWYLGVVRLNIAKKSNPEKLTTIVKVFAYPWLIVGLIGDVLLGTIIGSILFLQLPHWDRLLFTAVLNHNVNGNGYRRKLARWFATELLDKFDWMGKHTDCFEPDDEAEKCQ